MSKNREEKVVICAENALEMVRVNLRAELESFLRAFPSAGVGECGLDKNTQNGREKSANKEDASLENNFDLGEVVKMDSQMSILSDHLSVAEKFHRPVTIHCVSGCWLQLLQVLQANNVHNGSIPAVVLHSCHSMPLEMLAAFFAAVGDNHPEMDLDLPLPVAGVHSASLFNVSQEKKKKKDGKDRVPNTRRSCRLFLSMSGRVFNSPKGIKLTRAVPLNRLLIETDSPDQLPVLYISKNLEGTRLSYNQPGTLPHICEEMAKIVSIDTAQFADITSANARVAYSIIS